MWTHYVMFVLLFVNPILEQRHLSTGFLRLHWPMVLFSLDASLYSIIRICKRHARSQPYQTNRCNRLHQITKQFSSSARESRALIIIIIVVVDLKQRRRRTYMICGRSVVENLSFLFLHVVLCYILTIRYKISNKTSHLQRKQKVVPAWDCTYIYCRRRFLEAV